MIQTTNQLCISICAYDIYISKNHPVEKVAFPELGYFSGGDIVTKHLGYNLFHLFGDDYMYHILVGG
jgi:hypothetical protein